MVCLQQRKDIRLLRPTCEALSRRPRNARAIEARRICDRCCIQVLGLWWSCIIIWKQRPSQTALLVCFQCFSDHREKMHSWHLITSRSSVLLLWESWRQFLVSSSGRVKFEAQSSCCTCGTGTSTSTTRKYIQGQKSSTLQSKNAEEGAMLPKAKH